MRFISQEKKITHTHTHTHIYIYIYILKIHVMNDKWVIVDIKVIK
jgi:hypothetical protein